MVPESKILNKPAVSTFDFKVCAFEEVLDGSGRVFQFVIEQKELSLLVLRSGDCCYGYFNRCPHFGLPLAESDLQLKYEPHQWVKCNVHYARFRFKDGFCEAGDCEGEYLERIPLEIHSGNIWINL